MAHVHATERAIDIDVFTHLLWGEPAVVILTKTHTALQQLDKGIAVGERCLRNAQSDTSRNIMEVYCALALEDAYYQQGQYRDALKLIETYQNDPLITSQPLALEQFTSHKKYIKEISPPVN